jgi:hypothetical protein
MRGYHKAWVLQAKPYMSLIQRPQQLLSKILLISPKNNINLV